MLFFDREVKNYEALVSDDDVRRMVSDGQSFLCHDVAFGDGIIAHLGKRHAGVGDDYWDDDRWEDDDDDDWDDDRWED